VDGSDDRLLLKGRGGDPERQLCDFKSKQFSSDGRRLYFLTPAWTTSNALHVFDMRAGDEHFLLPANGFLVLNFCRSKYTDHLVVLSHRHFLFGGSYDWYWLYDPSGKKELGPLGHFNNREDLIRQAHGEWLRGQALALILCPGEWLHRCDVGQFELDPLLAVPAIERKAAGGVHLPAAAVA